MVTHLILCGPTVAAAGRRRPACRRVAAGVRAASRQVAAGRLAGMWTVPGPCGQGTVDPAGPQPWPQGGF